MSRRVPRTRAYDVVFVGKNDHPVDLTTSEIARIGSIVGHHPSSEFVEAYRYLIGSYAGHRLVVANSTAPALRKRFEAVIDASRVLHRRLSSLTPTDLSLYSRYTRLSARRGKETLGIDEYLSMVSQMAPNLHEAIKVLDQEPRRGRMPSFAEQALAKSVAQILFEETKVVPTSKKGGKFDRLLRLALSRKDGARARVDVADLMDLTLITPPTTHHLLDVFRNDPRKSRPDHPPRKK